MLICCEDVGTTSAPFRCRLCITKVRFNEGGDFVHETSTEDSSQGRWELQGSLPVGGVGPFLFWNPYAKVDVDSEDEGLVPVVGVNETESVPQEARGEGYSRMIDLVGSIVSPGHGIVVGKSL